MNNKKLLAGVAIVLALIALQSLAVHNAFTSRVLGGNDFYPRWAGARALLVEGRNPYDPSVTEEIIAVMDPQRKGLNSFSFAYPLHVIFVMGPLAYLPYEWAIAIWMVIIQWMAIGTMAIFLLKERWLPSPAGLLGLLLASILFYPVARSMILGQFTLHVTFFVMAALLALRHRRDGLSGIFLAATSIKPQMVLLVIPWFLLWALKERRTRLILGFVGSGVGLLLASMAILPRWPISFLQDLRRYSSLASGKEPLAVMADLILPGGSPWLRYALALLLSGALLYTWWRGLRNERDLNTVLHWTIAVNLLVLFQTGTTNQTLLLIPLLAWLAAVRTRWKWWVIGLAVILVYAAIWLLFLETIQGDYENPLLLLPLPILTLLVLAAQEARLHYRPALKSTGQTIRD